MKGDQIEMQGDFFDIIMIVLWIFVVIINCIDVKKTYRVAIPLIILAVSLARLVGLLP